jgi:hypothetical protein
MIILVRSVPGRECDEGLHLLRFANDPLYIQARRLLVPTTLLDDPREPDKSQLMITSAQSTSPAIGCPYMRFRMLDASSPYGSRRLLPYYNRLQTVYYDAFYGKVM